MFDVPTPRLVARAAALLLLAAPAARAADPPLVIDCQLQAAGSRYAGSCSVPCSVNALAVNFDGVVPARACAAPTRTAAVTLARTAVPRRWLGTMEGVKPEDPTRMELVPDEQGTGSVARLPYGWFAVDTLQADDKAVLLRVNASRQMRPTAADLKIIDRALALMPSTEVWNKADNRECPAGQSRISLFCAMMNATTEVSGGVHYRQPAMQAVREELNLVDKARIKTHRIMDFNNHPDTTLAEVHALLQRAKERVRAEMR
jgi:hypothetical protein